MAKNFKIPRRNKFWSGVASHMTIEQTLMRSILSVGGLTRGRGIKESVMSKWILAIPSSSIVCDNIENYANKKSVSSYQQVDWSTARHTRDERDADLLYKWFSEQNPFTEINEPKSLSSGVVAGDEVNLLQAYDVGSLLMSIFFDIEEAYK